MGQEKSMWEREAAQAKQLRARARKTLMKRTKEQLVANLEEVCGHNRELREKLKDLEPGKRGDLDYLGKRQRQVDAAVDLLARSVAEHLATDGDVVDSIRADEKQKQMHEVLRAMLGANAMLTLVLTETDVISSCVGNRDECNLWDMVRAVDEAQAMLAQKVVAAQGAQDLVAQLVRLQREREE